MKRLWAPWRAAYVAAAPEAECLLCRKALEDVEAKTMVLERSRASFAMLNAYPYNAGHLMVVPLRHTDDLASLTAEEAADLLALAGRALRALERTYGPEGYNLGINLGRAAGAGIVEHLHLHVVPRWTGDTNFMPAVGETKVIPEDLATTYRRLREAFASLEDAS